MKTAQELRAGNVFMVGNDPMVVQKTEYIKRRPLFRQSQHETEKTC